MNAKMKVLALALLGLAGYAVGEIAELFTDPPDNLVFLNDWNKNV